MINKILSWSKENYEKLILGVLSILLILTLVSFLTAGDKQKELEDFKKMIQPPASSPVTIEPIQIKNAGSYIKATPKSYYQPISERAVFFPAESKKPVVTTPNMNLECRGISMSGNVLVAILKNSITNAIYNVQEGEQLENFIVISITRDVVILSGEGRQYRLPAPPVVMPFKLTGIMPTETGAKEAMLQNEVTRRTSFVKEGDKVENWDVLNISENAVIISKLDAGKYELKIGGESKRIQE